MKYKAYRICLLSLVILAVVGGIFYYRSVEENQTETVDGTFVERMSAGTEEYLASAGEWLNAADAFCRNAAVQTEGGSYESR